LTVSENVARLQVTRREKGIRLDAFLSHRLSPLTRSQAERLARAGKVSINGRRARPGDRVHENDRIEVTLADEPAAGLPTLEIVHEDDYLLVVNKPPGLLVHPGPGGSAQPTLASILARHTADSGAAALPRGGLVHRLDRFTSGLVVVAKTEEALNDLSQQVRERQVERHYLALVWGVMREDRLLIDIPVGRLLRDPARVVAAPGPAAARRSVPAATDVRVLDRHARMTLVEARLLTGRTHQIRVHLNHLGHPVLGDPVYGLRRSRAEMRALDGVTRNLVKCSSATRRADRRCLSPSRRPRRWRNCLPICGGGCYDVPHERPVPLGAWPLPIPRRGGDLCIRGICCTARLISGRAWSRMSSP